MNKQLNMLTEIILLELRVQRRNPIWMISIAAAALLGFSEAFTAGILDWPTTNQAFRAYQLGCVMIFGLMTFLLTAGALSRDLSDGRKDLLLCRPISPWVYIWGKYFGNILFALCINILFMILFLVIPLFYGQSSIYPLRPFILLTLFSTLPTILYSGALAVLLMCLSRKVIVAVPVFLVYFLAMALFRIPETLRGIKLDVDLWDFSMRMYPHSVSANVGASRLTDVSFSHLLQPPVPELYARAALYATLSIVAVGLSVLLLKRMRNS
jgi:ABC-type transport system involved in multi-copper enzyme maturation permease subunit